MTSRVALCAASVQHLANRLVRCLLGPDAVADRKVEWGNPLTILGVSTAIAEEGMRFTPDAAKAAKWKQQIDEAIRSRKLCAGEASKLAGESCALIGCGRFAPCFAGRLTWTSQFAFRRLGRAMLYPLFRQQRARQSAVNEELLLALRWWSEVLGMEYSELRPWTQAAPDTVHLICDARSKPPRVAAILVCGATIYFSDMEPSPEVSQRSLAAGPHHAYGAHVLHRCLSTSRCGGMAKLCLSSC